MVVDFFQPHVACDDLLIVINKAYSRIRNRLQFRTLYSLVRHARQGGYTGVEWHAISNYCTPNNSNESRPNMNPPDTVQHHRSYSPILIALP
jgi:hypothetical protein